MTDLEWPVVRHDSDSAIPNRFELIKGVYGMNPQSGTLHVIFGNHKFGGAYLGAGCACEEQLLMQSTDLAMLTSRHQSDLRMKTPQCVVVEGVYMDTWWNAEGVEKKASIGMPQNKKDIVHVVTPKPLKYVSAVAPCMRKGRRYDVHSIRQLAFAAMSIVSVAEQDGVPVGHGPTEPAGRRDKRTPRAADKVVGARSQPNVGNGLPPSRLVARVGVLPLVHLSAPLEDRLDSGALSREPA